MITISVCMIVKNEEAVLARCLDSLEGLYDELVIVDTGSNDRTKEIAAGYTDKVYDFEWVNDFSKARNFAFSKCTKDYIYSVDADEVLDAENRSRFITLANRLIPEIEIVQMWYINTNEYATTENFSKELRPKLYKRLREFTWIDPIHESVNLNPVVYDSDIEILHMPVSNHADRDFKTFENAIARGEHMSDKLLMMYARELMIAGEKQHLENARDFFIREAVNDNRSAEHKQMCYVVLAKGYMNSSDPVSVSEFFKWCLKNVGGTPCSEICLLLGDHYFAQDDMDEAFIWYCNALNEAEPILEKDSGRKKPLLGMAAVYRKLAEADEENRESLLYDAKEIEQKALEND